MIDRRPSWETSLVPHLDQVQTYSFPSGHVMFYTVFFGFLIFLIFVAAQLRHPAHPPVAAGQRGDLTLQGQQINEISRNPGGLHASDIARPDTLSGPQINGNDISRMADGEDAPTIDHRPSGDVIDDGERRDVA